jgi:hypothetical protein
MKKGLFLLFFSLSFYSLLAQTPNKLSLRNQEYNVSEFKQDSILSFSDWYTENHIITSIKNSRADFEVRMVASTQLYKPSFGYLFIIKGVRDSFFFELTHFEIGNSADSSFRHDHILSFYGGGRNSAIFGSTKRVTPRTNIDSTIQRLINNKLFTLQDYSTIIDSINKANGKINPKRKSSRPGANYFFQVKVKNMYRNFRVDVLLANSNHNTPDFLNAENLVSVIYEAFWGKAKFNHK